MRFHATTEGQVQFTAEDEAAADAREAAWSAGEQHRNTLAQIEALEATITPRRMRDAATGKNKAWLVGIDNQIEALRALLA